MKLPYSKLVAVVLLTVTLFAGPAAEAQYKYTNLDLLGSPQVGSIAASGTNVALTYVDANKVPSAFLYTGSTQSYAMINYPLSLKTATGGIDGTNVVGGYEDSGKVGHGFLFSGGSYTSITYPGSLNTAAAVISGANILGDYEDSNKVAHGFLYNNGTYTSITYPGSKETTISAISGSTIVGTYQDTNKLAHGFTYNGGTYASINFPGANGTTVGGVSGNNIVGTYKDSNHVDRGFIYNGATYTSIFYPGSRNTGAIGVSGNTVTGTYQDTSRIIHGFTYNGGTYTSIDVAGSRGTGAVAISGTNVVGAYEDVDFIFHGFLAIIPLSASVSLGSLNATYDGTSKAATATTSPTGLNVTFTYGGSSTPPTNAGSYAVVGTVNDPTYVGTGTGTLVIAQAAQQLLWLAIHDQEFPDSLNNQVQLSANTLSGLRSTGLPITFSILSGPATVSGSTLTLTGTGSVTVQASQPGNANYLPLTPATQTFAVTATPLLTFSAWEQLHPQLTDLAPEDTPEGDGVPTLLKYLYDIGPAAPMTAADRTALPVFAFSSGNLTLTYRQYGIKTGITIHVQTSSDLQTWTTVTNPTILQTGIDPTTGDPIMQVQVPATGAREFLRLNVTSP